MSGDLSKRKYMDGVTSTLIRVHYSLRAVVPNSIVKLLELEEGDRLRWQMRVDENKEIVVEVRPLKVYRG